MFGGLEFPKKPPLRAKPPVKIVPGIGANNFGRMAPHPNSRYMGRLMQYEQRKKEFLEKREANFRKKLNHTLMLENYIRHSEKQEFLIEFRARFNRNMKQFQGNIEERRKKLSKLLTTEEKEYDLEIIRNLHQKQTDKTMEIENKLTEINRRKAAERAEIVKEKRLQQNKNEELRTTLVQQRLMESKEILLVQMSEKLSRKESEKEVDQMWHLLTLKEIEAKKDRENQELLKKQSSKTELNNFAEVHAKLLQLQKDKERHKLEEEKQRLNKLREEEKREKQAAIDKKSMRRDEALAVLRNNLEVKKQKDKRIAQEEAVAKAYAKLAAEELAKEKARVKEKSDAFKQELDTFRMHLTQEQAEQVEQEKRVDEILKETLDIIQRKQDEETCKAELARKALQENVLKELAEQIAYRREKEIEEVKKKEEEIKCNRSLWECNERVREAFEQRKKMAALQYREDLKKQIEHSKLQKESEKMEENRFLQRGKNEEQHHNEIKRKILSRELSYGLIHPFHKIINNCSSAELCKK